MGCAAGLLKVQFTITCRDNLLDKQVLKPYYSMPAHSRPRGPFSPPFFGPTVIGSLTAAAPLAPQAAIPANPAATGKQHGVLCHGFKNFCSAQAALMAVLQR